MIILLTAVGFVLFGLLAGPVFLFVAMQLLFSDLQYGHHPLQPVLAFMLLIAPAVAACLAGLLIEEHCDWRIGKCVWYPTALVGGLAFSLRSGGGLDQLGTVILSTPTSGISILKLLLSVFGGATYCGALIGLLLAGTALLCELPFLWVSRQAGLRFAALARGMRPLILVFTSVVTLNLLADFLTNELAPRRVLDRFEQNRQVECG